MTLIDNATPEQLASAMDFDHVIRVLPGRVIETHPAQTLYAPEMLDDEIDSDQWTVLTGFTGQYGYAGPTLHSSEYIGGGLAEYILDTPGLYVAIMSDHSPQTPEDEADDEAGQYDGVEGWAVAYSPS